MRTGIAQVQCDTTLGNEAVLWSVAEEDARPWCCWHGVAASQYPVLSSMFWAPHPLCSTMPPSQRGTHDASDGVTTNGATFKVTLTPSEIVACVNVPSTPQ
eukprot:1754008-Amphidinium_carterae.1